MQEPTFKISRSLIQEWYKVRAETPEKYLYLRVGQHFFNHFGLHKIVSEPNKSFLDVLYETDGVQAFNMIVGITDYEN